MHRILTIITLSVLIIFLLGCYSKIEDPKMVTKLLLETNDYVETYRSTLRKVTSYAFSKRMKNNSNSRQELIDICEKLSFSSNLHGNLYYWHSSIFLDRTNTKDTILAKYTINNHMVRTYGLTYEFRTDSNLKVEPDTLKQYHEYSYKDGRNIYQKRLSQKIADFFESLSKFKKFQRHHWIKL